MRYLDQEPNSTSVDAIKGIWVATDDATVMGEVRTLANAYFPSVHSEDIVFAAGGVPGGVQTSKITTHSVNQVPTHDDHETVAPLRAFMRCRLRSPVRLPWCHSCLSTLRARVWFRIRRINLLWYWARTAASCSPVPVSRPKLEVGKPNTIE